MGNWAHYNYFGLIGSIHFLHFSFLVFLGHISFLFFLCCVLSLAYDCVTVPSAINLKPYLATHLKRTQKHCHHKNLTRHELENSTLQTQKTHQTHSNLTIFPKCPHPFVNIPTTTHSNQAPPLVPSQFPTQHPTRRPTQLPTQ